MHTKFSNGIITIRPFEPEDVSDFFATVRSSVNSLKHWMPWCHAEYSMEEAQSWLKSCQHAWSQNTSYPFLIVDAGCQKILGSVDINQINREHNFANLGYWVVSTHTGRGTATAAVEMATRFGFSQAGFTRLEIVILVDNAASRRVAIKAGAKLECVARNRLTGWGKVHDAVVYSIVPTDVAS